MNNTPSVVTAAKGLKVSHHTGISLELGKDNSNYVNKGWSVTSLSWNEPELLNAFRNSGIMPGILNSDHKLNSNVIGFQSIIIDFDNGTPRFDEMLDKVKQFEYAAFLFTSVNHGKEKITASGIKPACDRFRLLIPFNEIITTDEFKRLGKIFKKIYPGADISFDTINRYFAPTPATLYYLHDTDLFLDAKSLIPVETEKSKNNNKLQYFSLEDYVTLSDNKDVQIKDISSHTPIICKYCDPDKRHNNTHNAFLDINSEGIYYQFCSSEQITRWQSQDEIDFSKTNLFFSEDTGTPIYVNTDDENHFHIFKSEKDWQNFCFHNHIDSKINIKLPRLKGTFNPQLPYGPTTNGYFNSYVEPSIITNAKQNKIDNADLNWLKINCPTISKVLWNLFSDDDTVEHFLNWFSYIAAEKQKPFTTFLIVSIPGAGKNVLFERVLSKLIGDKQSEIIFSERMGNRFNSSDAHLILKAIDELYAPNNYKLNESRKQFIKSDIGSTYKTIESKGVDSFKVPNFMSYILFSNVEGLAFAIDNQDRRFNVIHNKSGETLAKTSWWMGRSKFEELIDSEVKNFAVYTVSRVVNVDKANTAIMTLAKEEMQHATEEDSQTFIRLLKNSKWDEFGFDEMQNPQLPDNLTDICKTLDGIPAIYIKAVMRELLGSDRLSMKKRLIAQGMFSVSTKDENRKSIKVYRA